MRRPVGGKHNSLVGLIEGVEGVEKFLLSLDFLGQKLHIVYHQKVDMAVLLAKCLGGVVTDGVNQLVGEFFAGNVQYPLGGIIFQHLVADGVHEMGLAQAYAAVHEQGIVGLARLLGHGQGSCMGYAVEAAGNEVVKNVLGVQGGSIARCYLGKGGFIPGSAFLSPAKIKAALWIVLMHLDSLCLWLFNRFFCGPVFQDKSDFPLNILGEFQLPAGFLAGILGKILVPFLKELNDNLVVSTEGKGVISKGYRLQGLQPAFNGTGG